MKLTSDEKVIILLALEARRNNILETLHRMPNYQDYYKKELNAVNKLHEKITDDLGA